MIRWTGIALVVVVSACGGKSSSKAKDELDTPATVEATSLLGTPLTRPALKPEVRAKHEAKLAAAKKAYDKDPSSADAIIWLGRRQAYLGRYGDAIGTFAEGIRKHPADARMYRHRGHRYITVRQFDRAVADLEKAALIREGLDDEVEPDGLPNKHNVPTSTLHTNIYYHLGLAYFLRGEYTRAAAAYRSCMAASNNDDMKFATAHWLYMALQRAGDHGAAREVIDALPAKPTILENTAYYQLVRLYRKQLEPEALETADDLDRATVGFGLSNWYDMQGREDDALPKAREVIGGSMWPAFGYIAAESDVARAEGKTNHPVVATPLKGPFASWKETCGGAQCVEESKGEAAAPFDERVLYKVEGNYAEGGEVAATCHLALRTAETWWVRELGDCDTRGHGFTTVELGGDTPLPGLAPVPARLAIDVRSVLGFDPPGDEPDTETSEYLSLILCAADTPHGPACTDRILLATDFVVRAESYDAEQGGRECLSDKETLTGGTSEIAVLRASYGATATHGADGTLAIEGPATCDELLRTHVLSSDARIPRGTIAVSFP